jgi:hypothetical protein
MESRRLEIATTVFRLCGYTAREAGVAVLAHTDAGTADLFVDGNHHENILTELNSPGGPLLRLRSRRPGYYEIFDLLGPIAPDLLTELGDQYSLLIQARFGPEEMDELLKSEGF